MNNTIDTTVTMENEEFDFELIKADCQDLVNYINNNKENLDKDKLKELRDNLVQLETILNNILGDKPKVEKKATKKISKKVEVETFDDDEGKKFYDNLKVGDEFTYVMASGVIITAKKVETKSKSGLSAACEVVSGLDIPVGKTKRRYPKFNKILKIQNVKNPVEETVKIDEVKQPITEEIKQVASVETNFNDTETNDDDLLDFDINDLDKDFDIE